MNLTSQQEADFQQLTADHKTWNNVRRKGHILALAERFGLSVHAVCERLKYDRH